MDAGGVVGLQNLMGSSSSELNAEAAWGSMYAEAAARAAEQKSSGSSRIARDEQVSWGV